MQEIATRAMTTSIARKARSYRVVRRSTAAPDVFDPRNSFKIGIVTA
jgi:hypothetical protein